MTKMLKGDLSQYDPNYGESGAEIYARISPTGLPLPVKGIDNGDGTSSLSSAGGGGTQYTDGVTQSTPIGTVALAKNPSNVLHALAVDSSGNLLVAVTGAGSGGTSSVDKAVWVAGTTAGTPTMAAFDDTSPSSVSEDQVGVVRMSANRNMYHTIRDAAGNERGANVNASNQLSVSVDNTVTVASHAVTNAGTFAVQAAQSGTWNITNVSGTVSLPTGASTAAKQPALGTAGSASTDVLTVQGIASMTPLLVTATLGAGATTIGKAEDSASANADVGVPAMAIQSATPADTAGTDLDYSILQMSAGRLWTSSKIDTALPAGSNVIGHVITDTGSTTVVTGTVTVGTHAVTIASGGVASGAIASGAIASGAVASGAYASGAFASGSISAGAIAAGATSFVKLEDVASADADAGVPAMAIQKATPADTAGTDGDYAMLQMSAGRVWASSKIDTALPSGANLIGKFGIDQTTVGTTNAVSLAQIGTTTVATGNGVAGTGVQRVTIASDNSTIAVSGTLTANRTASTSGAPTSPSISTTSATVLALNNSRKLAFIRSPTAAGTVSCYLRYDGSAATTSQMELARGEFIAIEDYTGLITGITASGTVVLQVVEFA